MIQIKYSFDSVHGKYIVNFILEKRALGYKFETEEYILHKFNDYWMEYNGDVFDVTPETLGGWLVKRDNECTTTLVNRMQAVRQYLKYLSALGFGVYIPTLKYSESQPIACVLSSEEIIALFNVIDNYFPIDQCAAVQRLAKEYRILYRLMITTGMRRGEVSLLKLSNISLRNKTITILNSKNQKDRIIYCADDMLNLIENYFEYLKTTDAATSPWLFPSVKPD